MRALACFCLLLAASVACAEEPPFSAGETTISMEYPNGTSAPPKGEDGKSDENGWLFCQRNRHALTGIMSYGRKHFDIIEWVSKPDLLTLADLTMWQAPHEFDFDGWLNFNIHWWAGPQGDANTVVPNLPPRVYDLNLHLSWRQRWAEGIATEVTILPGLYTDFRTTPPDAFRIPGHAVGVYQLTPELHFVGGVQYLQRNHIKLLPVGGFLWEPDPRWQWRLVFPEPKISYHLDSSADVWVYARGEYGGGRWAYKDDFGHADHVEYSDMRVAVGFECGSLTRTLCPRIPLGTAFFEAGYVFNRNLNFTRGTPSMNLPPGWMISFGCTR
jgi:hypothetical protein